MDSAPARAQAPSDNKSASLAPRAPEDGPTADSPAEVARQHFELAEEHFAARRYAEAAGHYLRAYEARPHPDLLFNVAQTYRNLGDEGRAVELFRRYLRAKPHSRHRRAIQSYIKSTRAHRARISRRLSASASPAGGTSDPHAGSGTAAPHEPPNRQEARPPALAAANSAAPAQAGSLRHLGAQRRDLISRGPDASAQEHPRSSPPSETLAAIGEGPHSKRRWTKLTLYSGLSLSAGLLIAGAVTGGLALDAHSKYTDLERTASEREEFRGRGEVLSSSTTALLSTAGALAAASLIIYWSFSPSEDISQLSVSLLGPGGPGLALGQRF